MKVSLLGAPGCGKGTQAKLMCEKFNIPHISTGDLFREAIKNKTPLGLKIEKYMSKLVPDEIVIDLVKERISKEDCKNGFILDGFPRTINQAEIFDNRVGLDAVIYFDIDLNLAKKRILERRTCTNCGEIFTVSSQEGDKCPSCGGKIDIRDEDKKVDERLATYTEQTAPLVDYYSKKGSLKVVNVNKFKDLNFAEGKTATLKEIEKLLEGLK